MDILDHIAQAVASPAFPVFAMGWTCACVVGGFALMDRALKNQQRDEE